MGSEANRGPSYLDLRWNGHTVANKADSDERFHWFSLFLFLTFCLLPVLPVDEEVKIKKINAILPFKAFLLSRLFLLVAPLQLYFGIRPDSDMKV